MLNLRRFLGILSSLILLVTAACSFAAPEKGSQPTTDLDVHEKRGGHLLARHVNKTDQELIQRLQNDSKISGASTFTDRSTAQEVVDAILTDPDHQQTIQQWLKSNKGNNLALDYKGDEVIGRGVFRDSPNKVYNLTNAVIILKKDEKHDYYILTGYPKK